MEQQISSDIVYKHIIDIKNKHNLSFTDATLKYINDTGSSDEFFNSMKQHKRFTQDLKSDMTKLHFFKKEPTLEDLF